MEHSSESNLECSEAQKYQRLELKEEATEEIISNAFDSGAVIPRLSVAQQCYDDVLHSLFAFLSLNEVLEVARTCHRWRNAAVKERSRDQWVSVLSSAQLRNLSDSPYKRHCNKMVIESKFPLAPSHLRLIRDRLPHVNDMQITVAAAPLIRILRQPGAWVSFVAQGCWSSQLGTLDLQFIDAAHTTVSTQLLLDTLPVASNLTNLALLLHHECNCDLHLAFLLRLPKLSSLTLDLVATKGWIEIMPSGQLGIFKQIDTLRYLSIRQIAHEEELLQELCGAPHRLLQLEEFDLHGCDIVRQTMEPLSNLPGLTAFNPNSIEPEAFHFLAGFRHLCTLTLDTEQSDPTEQHWTDLFSNLRLYTKLTELDVGGTLGLKLSELLSCTPQLLQLTVRTLMDYDDGDAVLKPFSLDCLLPCSLLKTLSIFSFERILTASDVLSLQRIAPRLQSLSLNHSRELDDTEIEQLRVAPAQLPFTFECTCRSGNLQRSCI
jgi:hypothetical protein